MITSAHRLFKTTHFLVSLSYFYLKNHSWGWQASRGLSCHPLGPLCSAVGRRGRDFAALPRRSKESAWRVMKGHGRILNTGATESSYVVGGSLIFFFMSSLEQCWHYDPLVVLASWMFMEAADKHGHLFL